MGSASFRGARDSPSAVKMEESWTRRLTMKRPSGSCRTQQSIDVPTFRNSVRFVVDEVVVVRPPPLGFSLPLVTTLLPTGTSTPIRRFTLLPLAFTKSVYGRLLIFFSPWNRETTTSSLTGMIGGAGCACVTPWAMMGFEGGAIDRGANIMAR